LLGGGRWPISGVALPPPPPLLLACLLAAAAASACCWLLLLLLAAAAACCCCCAIQPTAVAFFFLAMTCHRQGIWAVAAALPFHFHTFAALSQQDFQLILRLRKRPQKLLNFFIAIFARMASAAPSIPCQWSPDASLDGDFRL
jgi:hypothetical protein